MNQQEIFDKVVKYARLQNKRAVIQILETRLGLGCRYRTKDGCKCFMGSLIPNDMYISEMEGRGIGDPMFAPVLNLLEATENADLLFLHGLQNIHDTHEPKYWEHEFKIFASEHDLIYSNPE